MRRRLMAGLGLVGLLVAGCGGGAADPPSSETGTGSSVSPSTSETKSDRSAPPKVVSIADKCSIITPDQQKSLAVEKPPRELTSNGHDGCSYEKGETGEVGWQMFVAVNDKKTYADEVEKRSNPTKETEVSGYPVSIYKDSTGCLLYADIADDGLFIANTSKLGTEDPGIDLCQHGEKFIEAAVKNLPDA